MAKFGGAKTLVKKINRLTARAASALAKPGRHADGGGLYLKVDTFRPIFSCGQDAFETQSKRHATAFKGRSIAYRVRASPLSNA